MAEVPGHSHIYGCALYVHVTRGSLRASAKRATAGIAGSLVR